MSHWWQQKGIRPKLLPCTSEVLRQQARPSNSQWCRIWSIQTNYCRLSQSKVYNTGFPHRPWIQDQPWKVLKFHKTEKVFELFWKASGRSRKVWNLPMWNFQQDFVTWWLWELSAIFAIMWVEELLRPLIINKRHARMLQIGVFFLKYH